MSFNAKLAYRKYLKERPGLYEHPFELVPLFTAEKFNDHPGLNERTSQTRKGALIWKFPMYAEALNQIVCKNDETRVLDIEI